MKTRTLEAADKDPKAPYWLRDPTENVIRLVEANKSHADEIRVMHDRYISAEIATVRETVKWMEKLADVHQKHDYALHKAEAGRLDALRQNDREDVKLLAAQTVAKADALQNQLSVTATTLQAQVLTTAETLAKSIAADQAEQNKRLSAIEKQQAEGAGKQAVADPMLIEMREDMKRLILALSNTGGEKSGKADQRNYIQWIIMIILALFAIAPYIRK